MGFSVLTDLFSCKIGQLISPKLLITKIKMLTISLKLTYHSDKHCTVAIKGEEIMKILRIRILVWLFAISLIMPGILSAKNMALELDGSTAIEVPNSDSINPKKAITIEAWMNMKKHCR